jgi:hypothetical protein
MTSPSVYVANESDLLTTWFVDEAGDPTLFARRGKPVVGTAGCSRFFIEGKLECRDVRALAADLLKLRGELLSDPYLKKIPSMDPRRRRTAVCFHAKDDPVEVRFLVFKLLAQHELRFVAVVRDKLRLLDYATQRRGIDPAYRYDANGHELYDELTRRLFSRLHSYGEHRVVFAQRGHKPRTKAFMDAIAVDDQQQDGRVGSRRAGPTEVLCGQPQDHAGLQAVDYYLWALQRFYERAETRYLDFIWPQTVEVIDVDAAQVQKRGKLAGDLVIFNEEHPLTLESRAGVGSMDREI